MRLSRVILFSFYRNAILAGILCIFTPQTLFSGTPVFDEWFISAFNFLAFAPIFFNGVFDRDLEKEYVRRNPIVYASGQNSESFTRRVSLRWSLLVLAHVVVIYVLNDLSLSNAGGVTSAFLGLMSNNDRDRPGDGEGGDLAVYSVTIYISFIIVLAIKVLFESRSIIWGEFPAFTCRKGVGEGWQSRLAYTWIVVFWLSIGFSFFFFYTYMLIGEEGAGVGTFFGYVRVTIHVFQKRLMTWMTIILIPVTCCIIDVSGKLFSNMYFPTQTQIHMEIQRKGAIRDDKEQTYPLGESDIHIENQAKGAIGDDNEQTYPLGESDIHIEIQAKGAIGDDKETGLLERKTGFSALRKSLQFTNITAL